jgi:hypothetical protein
MTPALAIARLEGWIYRVAREPEAWAWPDWIYADDDGTFGNRFDDPRGEYRVLYASSQREGAFAETLARFRSDLHVAAELQAIVGDPEDVAYLETVPGGVVPIEWIETRVLGIARHGGGFVDLGHSDSLAHLRTALADRVLHHGLDDLDAGDVRRRAPRRLTQEISRYLFERGRDAEGDTVAGVRYLSRLGDEFVNWAIFEPNQPSDATSEPIDRDDDALRAVLERFGLAWG